LERVYDEIERLEGRVGSGSAGERDARVETEGRELGSAFGGCGFGVCRDA
jgi:hypothetical protein